MSQYSEGVVRVTNGSNIVDGSWQSVLASVVGTFLPGETITGAGSFSAQVVDVISGVMRLILNGASPNPSATLVVTGATSTAHAALVAPARQMDWSDSDNAAIGDLLTLSGQRPYRQVQSITRADRLTIQANWDTTSLLGATYALSRDFTPHGLVRINQGDLHAAQLVTYNSDLIEALLFTPYSLLAVGGGGGAPAFAGVFANLGSNWQTLRIWRDLRNDVHVQGSVTSASGAAPISVFTLPAGYRPGKDLQFIISGGREVKITASTGVVSVESGTLTAVHLNLIFPGEA